MTLLNYLPQVGRAESLQRQLDEREMEVEGMRWAVGDREEAVRVLGAKLVAAAAEVEAREAEAEQLVVTLEAKDVTASRLLLEVEAAREREEEREREAADQIEILQVWSVSSLRVGHVIGHVIGHLTGDVTGNGKVM